jgi:hypothetical protein
MPLLRVTLFKIPDPADVETTLASYEKLKANNSKVASRLVRSPSLGTPSDKSLQDGKPYILQQSASKLYDDARTQGYTVSARTIFSSLDDMKYYDEECAAHNELKSVVKSLVKGGPPLIFYTDIEGKPFA